MKTRFFTLALVLSATSAWATPGVRTHVELLNAYLSLTQVPMNQSIRDVYVASRSRLPVQGVATDVHENMMMAVHQLAIGVCEAWAAAEIKAVGAGTQGILKSFKPTDMAANFDATLQTQAATDMTAAFWFRSPTTTEMKSLVAAQSSFASTPASLNSNPKPLVLGCATALSAVDIIRN